jgi:glycosyltransferase involved in cell wall biosynthesis
MRDEVAIYLPGGLITPPANPYGRLIANAGTYRAIANHPQIQHVHFQCRTPPAACDLADQVGLAQEQVTVGTPIQTSAPARAGLLFSGQPYLSEPAWVRRRAGKDTQYSIVGSIFAFSSPQHREQMMNSALAPLHPWDAMICSSPSLRTSVESTFGHWQEYLAERVGATTLPRPQLPVIPFGCDVRRVAEQADDQAARESLRMRLGVRPDEVVIYFLGRLSYYDKAFPQPMLAAVARAAADSGVAVHFVMTGWFPGGEEDRARFESAARRHAPEVPVSFLDGNDSELVAQCWAAADIFLLLSDTIIETFGQALVEAMAAGLPLVVSDWDGYRFIVRDGLDGFLVPSLGGPPGPMGQTIAQLESLGMLSYPAYAGTVAEHTAVSVEAAASALGHLLASADLRRTLGANAREQAFTRFSWSVVAEQYMALFTELDERRALAEPVKGRRMHPLRDDPFADFQALPSRVLDGHVVLRRTHLQPSYDPFDAMFPAVRATPQEVSRLLLALDDGPHSLDEVLAGFPAARRPFVRMGVMWLAKSGVIEWR